MPTRDYKIRLPRDVTIRAACEDVRCEHWLYGWDTFADEREDLGRRQAAYFRSGQSGREYREMGRNEDGVTIFRFASHQRCFREHRTRPARWLIRGTSGVREVPVMAATGNHE